MESFLYPTFYAIEKKHWWFTARQTIVLDFMKRHIPSSSHTRLLDVGCGTGALLEELTQQFNARGIEPSPEAVEFCRKRGLHNVQVGILADHPVTEQMNIITFFDVVEHVEDDNQLLRDAYERLTDDGYIVITVPAYRWMWSRHDEVNHHKRRYTRNELEMLVIAAGFNIVHSTYFNTLLFPIAVARRLLAGVMNVQDQAEFVIPPAPINRLLDRIFRLERRVVPYMSLPFGLSLLCLARKA